MEVFIAKILDNDLLPDLVDQTMQVDSLGQVETFFMARECLRALGQGQAPVNYSLNGFAFTSQEDQVDWLQKNHLDPKLTAKEALVTLLRENPTALKKVLSNAQARKLAFDLVSSKGLAEPLTLKSYANKFDKDYKKSKMAWMDSYPEITLQSSAKEDFLTIFKDKGAGDLAFKKSLEEEDIQAKKDLVKVLNKQGPEKIKLEPENKEGVYRDKDGKNARDYVSQKLMDLKVLEAWLKEDPVRNLAQGVLIDQGIYTGISIADGGYNYVSLKNKKDFYQASKVDLEVPDQEAFQGLRDKYDLSPKLSPYDARGILNLYYELNKQGNLAYLPIIVAYKIQDQTVAQISENFSENPGIAVASKPIRSYPLGKTAAHVLGYLGKISSEEDIKKYTKKGYERDAIIGKTGIEESFESYLHGKNGRQRVQVDAKGNTTAVLDERAPVAGKNVYLSIDLNLQKKPRKSWPSPSTSSKGEEFTKANGAISPSWLPGKRAGPMSMPLLVPSWP
ncbi:penicillin-binding protein dimerization domain protein [Peptoniphilus sp. oral taxon 375 str. F0436]|nr:penicillin-binding protein dimerization domain protein [Peptoniphilus sp. oral taxon 375 str. F0436]